MQLLPQLQQRSGGNLLPSILQGGWRPNPPPGSFSSQQIDQALPQLRASHTTALAWHRLKECSSSIDPAAAEELRNIYRARAIQEAVDSAALTELCTHLNRSGVTPLLFKGWAAAQYYAAPYLRTSGDFDLIVRREDIAATREVLRAHSIVEMTKPTQDDYTLRLGPRGYCAVDVHTDLPDVYQTTTDDLFARAQPAIALNAQLLVPSLEDHLRITVIHMWKHGGWRALWLCDVAAMLEATTADFNWQTCLTHDARNRDILLATFALARDLLACDLTHTPAAVQTAQAPPWLLAAIEKEWAAPSTRHPALPRGAVFTHFRVWLRARWPNALQATLHRGNVYRGARLPVQLAEVLAIVPASLRNVASPAWWRSAKS